MAAGYGVTKEVAALPVLRFFSYSLEENAESHEEVTFSHFY